MTTSSKITQANPALTDLLNRQIANWNVLFVKLHNYHWYVKGPAFFTLHVKFEELYNEAALHVDELAERLLAMQGQPAATMKEYLLLSSIQEAAGGESAEQMVTNIANDFNTIIGELKSGITLAESEGDDTTADMLLAVHQSLEKHSWMFHAFNNK